MNETHKGFLEYVQTLPDPAKKRVLIVAAVVIMTIIIYFWLAYFNNLIAGVAQSGGATQNAPANGAAAPTVSVETLPAPASASASAPAPQTASGPGFSQLLSYGTAYIYGAFANIGRALSNFFETQGHYSVEPPRPQQ